jgi:anti-sigma-K factor RskA
VSEFLEAAGRLADRVASPPPPELKNRVLAMAHETRQVSPASSVHLPRVGPRRLLAVAATVAVLAGGAGLGTAAWENHEDAQQARIEATRITDVLTDPNRTESAAQISGGGQATVVAAGGSAVFAARDLPAAQPGKTYQLWVIGGNRIRSAGLLPVEDGAARAWVTGVSPGSSLAVSVEPDGGSEQPTTTPITNVAVA